MKNINRNRKISTQMIATMSMMVALKIILSAFSIEITPTFKILSFGYLPGAIISLLYGPIAGLIFGFVADFAGYIVRPMGAYLPVYALSEMSANVLYAFFLYRKPLSVPRVTLAQLSVTISITFGLNYLWNSLLFGRSAAAYYTGARFLSNFINLFIYVILIIILGKLSLQLTKKSKFNLNNLLE